MYRIRIRIPGQLAELALNGEGTSVRTERGDLCVMASLATAQRLAKMFAAYGLLA